MLRQPLWVAIAIYSAYIGLGDGACQKANRAVNPLHWIGQVYVSATNNMNAAEGAPTILVNGADKVANSIRDTILVLTVGKVSCASFQSSVEPITAKEVFVELAPGAQAVIESPATPAPLMNKPIFNKTPDLAVVEADSKGANK